jgi:hypothetical protein
MHKLSRSTQAVLIAVIISGCTALGVSRFDQDYGAAAPRDREVAATTPDGRLYSEQVRPILEARCIQCHSCYEAPCQLNLNSPEGIDRGLSKIPVYSSSRLKAADPTRLLVDAQSTPEWRARGFAPVLNERNQTPAANLAGGLLYQSVALKAAHPLPVTPTLNQADFNFALNRKNVCPRVEEFSGYASKNPLAGMPYGLPGLTENEFTVLRRWLERGAPLTATTSLRPEVAQQVGQWETFLNQDSLKAQLVSRYIYEHLFLASLYFGAPTDNDANTEIFRLVRSSTPPGEAPQILATRRPSSDPGVARVYYRLVRVPGAIITKTHLPYALNAARLGWMQKLFFTADYKVESLPGYEEEFINPFITFAQIPANFRYRFLLEDAQFFIEGFIKGPVCRGQVAVDVINDRFWVFFATPDSPAEPLLDGFIASQSDNLRLPGNDGSSARILAHWTRYSKLNDAYLKAKLETINQIFDGSVPLDQSLVWNGDGTNPNAALTVFRNFDNAAVVQGLVGTEPKTAWLIGYPLLERIHYLLTVDFDVYGNVGHQLNTRLYMDFLRFDGEFNFLALLPLGERDRLVNYWYRDARANVLAYVNQVEDYATHGPTIDYQTANPKQELLGLIRAQIGDAVNPAFDWQSADIPATERDAWVRLQTVRGTPATLLPESTVISVQRADGSVYLYTLLSDRAHANIATLFREAAARRPEEDTLTIAAGIVGDYPNALVELQADELDDYVAALISMTDEADYAALMERFGIRRTNPQFWSYSDRLHAQYNIQQPHLAGWMDYSRLENR